MSSYRPDKDRRWNDAIRLTPFPYVGGGGADGIRGGGLGRSRSNAGRGKGKPAIGMRELSGNGLTANDHDKQLYTNEIRKTEASVLTFLQPVRDMACREGAPIGIDPGRRCWRSGLRRNHFARRVM